MSRHVLTQAVLPAIALTHAVLRPLNRERSVASWDDPMHVRRRTYASAQRTVPELSGSIRAFDFAPRPWHRRAQTNTI